MPFMLVALPLSSADLRTLAAAGYGLIDQAARTPGLLIAQAPDALTPAGPEGPAEQAELVPAEPPHAADAPDGHAE